MALAAWAKWWSGIVQKYGWPGDSEMWFPPNKSYVIPRWPSFQPWEVAISCLPAKAPKRHGSAGLKALRSQGQIRNQRWASQRVLLMRSKFCSGTDKYNNVYNRKSIRSQIQVNILNLLWPKSEDHNPTQGLQYPNVLLSEYLWPKQFWTFIDAKKNGASINLLFCPIHHGSRVQFQLHILGGPKHISCREKTWPSIDWFDRITLPLVQ